MEHQLSLRQGGGSSTIQDDKGQNYDPPLHYTQNTYTDYNVYTSQPSAPPIVYNPIQQEHYGYNNTLVSNQPINRYPHPTYQQPAPYQQVCICGICIVYTSKCMYVYYICMQHTSCYIVSKVHACIYYSTKLYSGPNSNRSTCIRTI